MKNEDKAKQIANDCSTHIVGAEVSNETYITTEPDCYRAAMEMAVWKDEQPISELGGWHKEEPTEDGWYLIKSNDFPKNCECMVAEWDNDAKSFYSEASDCPVSYKEWKLIERR